MIQRLPYLWAVLALSGCASPLTGLQCAEGFTQCGDECVDLDNDLQHCGSCETSCPEEGWQCVGGQCGLELPNGGIDFDASVPDGDVPDAPTDGGEDAGDGGDGGTSVRPIPEPSKPLCDGTLPADECRCDVGSLKCENICVDPDSDPDHCGGCDQDCGTGQVCAGGMCAAGCESPFVACGSLCIDVDSNFRHCGRCGNACPTHICIDGSCSGGQVGHVVVVGHNFRNTNPEQNKIPPGAVALNNQFNPRVLGYSAYSDPIAVENINLTLLDTVGVMPEEIEEVVLPALSLQLSKNDVLIIYPQPNLSQSDLEGKVRTAFDGVLPSFLEGGGVVLVFESGGGNNDGTFQLVTVDDLVDITGRQSVPVGPVLKTEAGFLGFTNGVRFPYRGESSTFGFEGIDPDDPSVLLYHEESDLPVVLHNIFRSF